MASGTLFACADSFRTYRIQIAAQYGGAKIKLDSSQKHVDVKKSPFGKVPVFESQDGKHLFETGAISCYVGKTICGKDDFARAEVQQWIEFADTDLLPAVLAIVLPSLSVMQHAKQQTDLAKSELLHLLKSLDDYLLPRTFLVGEHITLADITVCCNLLLAFQHVLEPAVRKQYTNVLRWFETLINQSEFKTVLGSVKLCDKAAQFDGKKFKEFEQSKPQHGSHESQAQPHEQPGSHNHPEHELGGQGLLTSVGLDVEAKKKKKGGKKDKGEKEAKQEKPRKTSEKSDEKHHENAHAAGDDLDATEEALSLEPKKKDPFESLPKTTFNFDEFKRVYSNEDIETKAIPYFWDHFDKENCSMWYCEYKFPKELTLAFMSCNLITGMYQRLDKMRKYAFGSMILFGSDNNSTIAGFWVWRGTELAFTLSDDWAVDYESYEWKKLDPAKDETKKLVKEYFTWEGDFGGKKVNQGKIFK